MLKILLFEKKVSISLPEANPAPIIEPNIKKINPKFLFFTK